MNLVATVNRIFGTSFGCKEETECSSYVPKVPVNVSDMYPAAFIHHEPDYNPDAPVSCVGCGAPMNGRSKCEYCGRLYPKHPESSINWGFGHIRIQEV